MRLGSYYTEGGPARACGLGDGGRLVNPDQAGPVLPATKVSPADVTVPTAGAAVVG